jgi:hypothetical protein
VVEHGESRRAHQRIAIKSAALVAMLETGRIFGRQERRQRHAAADAFAERHDVGFDAGMLVVEQLASPAHTGLDLVDDQQQSALLGQRAQLLQELIGRRPDAGFALDRLQHDRDRLGRDQPLDGLDVIELRFGKTRDLGLEKALEGLLARRRHGRERAAMEAADKGDDLMRPVLVERTEFAHELDRAFIGFGAGIGKELLVEATVRNQHARQFQARSVEESGARGQQLLCLRRNRVGHVGLLSGFGEEAGLNARRPHFAGAAFSKTLLN